MEQDNEQTSSNDRQPMTGGPGRLTAKDNPKPFTKDYQPGQAKANETRQKQKSMREAFKMLLSMKYTFENDSKIKKALEKSFGKKAVSKMSVGEVMALQQMQKAIKMADTQAFTSVLNQAMGMPKQEIEQVGERVVPNVILNMPQGIDINLPSNTDGDS